MLTLNDGRSELWQWDTGRTLSVDADCSQVHFSNKVFGRSIDVDVVGGTAIIPDVLLQTDKDFTVWAFVGTAENGYTKISKTFKVNRRNKPADYVFTPVEQTTIAEIAAIAQSVRDDADAGLFDGAQGPEGPIGPVGPKGEKGDTGATGATGASGADGKSAYQYAQEGGYAGTEAEFAAKLAAEIPTVDSTLTKSGQAADAAAVGDRLSSLSEEIANLGGGLLTVETITIGEVGNIPVTGIVLDYSNVSLTEGERMMLAASVAPSDATNNTVLWKSSDTSVATVDNGLVTAVSAGNATITAYSQENSSIEATCAVTVAAESGGGEDTGGGSADTSKIQLSTLNIVDGSLVNKSGSVIAINDTAHYVEIPYSDGMFVSTGMNTSWVNGYPPFMVFDNGTYTKPDYATGDLLQMDTAQPCQYSATLTGFSDGASVFVNMYYPAGKDIAAYDAYYYIPGGAK